MEPKRVGTLLFGLGVGLAALSAVVKIQAGNPAVHGCLLPTSPNLVADQSTPENGTLFAGLAIKS